MKKYLALVLSMLFVLGFAASALAIHASIPAETTGVVAAKDVQIQLEGEIRVRGFYEDNIGAITFWDDVNGDGLLGGGEPRAVQRLPYNKAMIFPDGAGANLAPELTDRGSQAWYDTRVRLAVDTKIGDNVSGRVHLETSPENYIWGGTSTVSTPGAGGSKRGTSFELLEAWIAYTGKGLLGVPAGIKVGHMPVVVGEGIFFDHRRYGDDALLLWVEPAKGTEINLLTAKLFEGGDSTITQRLCVPAGGGPGVWTTGGCGTGTDSGARRILVVEPGGTVDNTDDIDLYSLMLTHKLDKDNTIGANLSLVRSSDINTVASTVAFGSSPIAFNPFFTFTSGDLSEGVNAKMNLWNFGLNAKGTIAGVGYKATVDFQFGKIKNFVSADDLKFRGYGVTLGASYKLDPVTIRANFVYGSGDGNDDNKLKTFQTFVGNVIDPNLPTVVYNWRVMTAAGGLGTGIANTTAYNLGLTYSPIKDMTAHLDYYLLRASKKFDGTSSGDLGYSKKIGSELDLKLSYRLAKNLTYSINAGILFADDFYKNTNADSNFKPKDAVTLQHQIVLSF